MIHQLLYDDKILGKFCGHENSADGHHPSTQPILSPGNRLTLIFQTDESNPERHQNLGFSAKYQAIGSTYPSSFSFSGTSFFQYWTTSFNSVIIRHRRVFCARTWRWLWSPLFSDLPQHPWLISLLLSPWLWTSLRPADVCVWVLCRYTLKIPNAWSNCCDFFNHFYSSWCLFQSELLQGPHKLMTNGWTNLSEKDFACWGSSIRSSENQEYQ